MSQDIRPILAEWEHQPERVQVRIIPGDDGTDKIQMRIELGLLQMELNGRPDGQRPHGFESLLEFYEAKQQHATAASESFALDSKDCDLLMREGLQYYHRYLSAFYLGQYDLVARDTARNLRLFAFVSRQAASQRDRVAFEQYRPYVEMMYARAIASQSLLEDNHPDALARIDDGIKAIRRFLADHDLEDRESECSELQFLVRWRREIERERPLGPLEQLEQQLQVSVELEHYEEAARIRDQIQRLQGREP